MAMRVRGLDVCKQARVSIMLAPYFRSAFSQTVFFPWMSPLWGDITREQSIWMLFKNGWRIKEQGEGFFAFLPKGWDISFDGNGEVPKWNQNALLVLDKKGRKRAEMLSDGVMVTVIIFEPRVWVAYEDTLDGNGVFSVFEFGTERYRGDAYPYFLRPPNQFTEIDRFLDKRCPWWNTSPHEVAVSPISWE